jgi:tetratricopeptide (TPR) repeat protein
MAGVRDKEQNLQKAIQAYEEALKVYTRTAFPTDYATTQNNLGTSYANLADARDKEENLKKAIIAFEVALKVFTKYAFPVQYAMTQNNLGLAYARLGEVRKAIECYEQALAISREIGDRRGEGTDLGNLGLAYVDLGDYTASLKHLLPGLAILQSIESPDVQMVARNIAIVRKKLGERRFKALLDKVSNELGLELK